MCIRDSLYSDIATFGVRVAGWGASTSAQTELLAVASDVEAAAYTATEEAIKGMGGSGGILNVLEVLVDTNTLKRRDGVNACIAVSYTQLDVYKRQV